MLKKLILVTALISQTSLAATYEWHSSVIERVYPQSNGDFIVTFKTINELCGDENSVRPKYHWVKVGLNGVTQEGKESMLSTALAAGFTGRPVSINFDKDDSTHCSIRKLSVEF